MTLPSTSLEKLKSMAIAQTLEPTSIFLTFYQNSHITQEEYGYYTASLPRKEYCSELPTNYQVCKSGTVAMIHLLLHCTLQNCYRCTTISLLNKRNVKIPNATPAGLTLSSTSSSQQSIINHSNIRR